MGLCSQLFCKDTIININAIYANILFLNNLATKIDINEIFKSSDESVIILKYIKLSNIKGM
ncbi:hypothetical protein GCM10008014_42020 [Paenibacillus silvae]|uniref:Uncharacterized protein n=1 Tax=Paenibacillus silvae TaxID=1325358 RepID=A0ABQ1ZIH1_9BACL|nr:hypothetical protein GCM10008014_42020 [Paenibacillus silvae]